MDDNGKGNGIFNQGISESGTGIPDQNMNHGTQPPDFSSCETRLWKNHENQDPGILKMKFWIPNERTLIRGERHQSEGEFMNIQFR